MSIGEYIFGSKFRWLILDTLSNSKKPLSAYKIATLNKLDVITTYRVLKEFAELGIVESVIKGRKQTLYRIRNCHQELYQRFERAAYEL
ncbi:MAG: hypothetical protein ACUVTD_01650 [Nitrososphaerales archaeon]